MILATTRGNVEVQSHSRDLFSGADRIPRPGEYSGGTVTGRRVSTAEAVGLPTVLSAIRLLAESVGCMPLHAYKQEAGQRSHAPDTPQWNLLRKSPGPLQTPFDFIAYLVASLNGWGNAYALKAMTKGEVHALIPVRPALVRPKVKDNDISYDLFAPAGGKVAEVTRKELIHIPGVLMDSPFVGSSPIAIHANAIGIALGTEEYAGRFYANDATPAGALQMPFNADSQQAKDMREFWEDRHRGGRNAHRLAVLFGGATYQSIGVNAADAQIVEAQRWNVDQAARCFRLPPRALGAPDTIRIPNEQKNMELIQFSFLPWMTRIEQAFTKDQDLFPDRSGLSCEFDADYLMRADMVSRYGAYLQGRQAGWLNVDEIRAEEDRPPLPDGAGQKYQETPVGGAPNLQPDAPKDDNAPDNHDGSS